MTPARLSNYPARQYSQVRQRLDIERSGSIDPSDRSVNLAVWKSAHLYLGGRKIDDPHFRDPMARVECPLQPTVIVKAHVGNLDGEQHVRGGGMRRAIEVGTQPEHRQSGCGSLL